MSAPHGPVVFGPFVPMPTAAVELASAQLMDSSAVTIAAEQAVSLSTPSNIAFFNCSASLMRTFANTGLVFYDRQSRQSRPTFGRLQNPVQ